MNAGKQYKTKQREAILNFVKQQKDHYVTVLQVADYLEVNQIKVGLTTIYRTMDKLVEESVLARVSIEGMNGTCYRYLPQSVTSVFFSMKCEECGKVVNIQCLELEKLYEHLLAEHCVEINPGKTMFYGICNQCEQNRK